MGDKFVGSQDTTLLNGAFAVNTNGAFQEIPEAEIHELDLVVSAQSGGPQTIVVEADAGIVGGVQKTTLIHSFTVSDTTDQKQKVSLGGIPGGRKIRGRATVPSGSVTCVLRAVESRSGL